jgi:pimeloyl-ACP methyl ester carboxylesterase
VPNTGSFVEQGAGPALVLVPGIQGRWEYVRPAVESLATCFRVLTFSLSARRSPDGPDILDREVEQIVAALDERRIDRAIISGISYGGLVATRFAAMHPERTAALVLASTPGPDWSLRRRHEVYARWPRLLGPFFLAETPWRLRAEVAAALPLRADRWRFALRQLTTLVSAPISLSQMAERARLLPARDLIADCHRVSAPTLVVTGERALDHIVPVESTAAYATSIRGARLVVLEHTGHLGTITHPSAFTAAVNQFVRNARPGPDVASGFSRTASRSEVA